MTDKEKLLSIQSYEEFDCRREEFKKLKMDREIMEHLLKISPKCYGGKEELFKTKPEPGKRGTIGR